MTTGQRSIVIRKRVEIDAICAKYIKLSKDLRGVKIERPVIIHYSFIV